MVAEVAAAAALRADDIVALLDIRHHRRKEVDGQAIAGSLAALAEAVDACRGAR